MYNIKTLNKISPVGLEKFPATGYNYGDEITNPDAIMVRSASMHEYEFEKSLKCIARAGAGVNNIPLRRTGHRCIQHPWCKRKCCKRTSYFSIADVFPPDCIRN